MRPRTKPALVAAAGLVVGLILLGRAGLPGGRVVDVTDLAHPASAEVGSEARREPGQLIRARPGPPVRREVGTPRLGILVERPPDPHPFEIEVLVLDELDLPIEGADVFLAPLRRPLNFVGTTRADGRLVVRLRGRRETIELAMLVESPDLERARARGVNPGEDFRWRGGVLSGLRRIEARCDSVTRLVFVSRSDDVLGLWIEYERARWWRLARRPEDHATNEKPSDTWARARGEYQSWRSRPRSARGGIVPVTAPEAKIDDQGLVTFVAPAGPGGLELLARVEALEALGEFDAAERLEFRQRRVSPSRGAELVARRRARSVLPKDRSNREEERPVPGIEKRETTLSISVTREDGSPAAGAPITADFGVGWRAPAYTDSRGRCLLRGVTPGVARVRAGGGDLGICEQAMRLEPGLRNHWVCILQRGTEVRGRLVDESGRPRAHWQVELELTGEVMPHVDTAVADSEGRFAIPNLPFGIYRMLLRPPGPWGVFPIAIIDGVVPALGELDYLVSLDPGFPQTALLEVAHSTGVFRTDVEVRLWNEQLRRGVWITSRGPRRSLESMPFVPGSYEWVVGDPARGWTAPRWFGHNTLGRFGLGVVMLDEPGLLLLEEQTPEEAIPYIGLRLIETGSGLDVVVVHEGLEVELPLRLPAGNYRVEYADGSYRELELRPGGTVRFAPSFLEWEKEERG